MRDRLSRIGGWVALLGLLLGLGSAGSADIGLIGVEAFALRAGLAVALMGAGGWMGYIGGRL